MPRPSIAAIEATLVMRRWHRNQQHVTGQAVDPDTVRSRVERLYTKLSDYDRAYVIDNSQPTMRPYRSDQ